jgi:predicted O-linked N-acetylglucosamine transferase (SPINDLY family)
MALDLPEPPPPSHAHATAAQKRAHRQWQAGCSHARRDHWPLALLAFEQAAGLDRDAAYALAAAHALIKTGQPQRAVQRTRALRVNRPDEPLAYTLESHALLELGQAREAVQVLGQTPPQVPRDHDWRVSLAVALQRSGRHEEAVRAFMEALALKADDALSHFRLGMSFKDLGLKAEAAECVRTALLLGLGSSELAARAQLAFLEREACRWPHAAAAMAELRQAVRAAPAAAALETGAFVHAVLVDDALEQRKVAQHYARHVRARTVALPQRKAVRHAERLRIGYLSADFHQHATSQLAVQMLESHDRGRFEVTLFSAGPDDASAMRRRVRAACEHFVELYGRSHHEMALAIRERKIDILIDLKGATYGSLLPVMAYRAAPVQVSWLGFPGTSGADFIDYLIGDAVVTPLAHAPHFSEKLAQLPHCYQPNDSRRALPRPTRRADWGVPEDALLLCGFHQSYKISETVFDTWCRILRDVPRAVLWLLRWNANVEGTLRAAALARGIDATRIVFAPLLPADEHLTRLSCADLFLDAWPCNAHTTASEALWAGVPLVTLMGETFAQRVAASLLHTAGLDALACRDVEHYVSTASQLAADAQRRDQLRRQLLSQRATHALFDGACAAHDVEALYLRMWERATAGRPPEHLPALAAVHLPIVADDERPR